MWAFQKKLMEGNDRRSRGERIQTLRRQGNRSYRDVIRELTKNDSTLRGIIKKEKEEISFLKEERKWSRHHMDEVGEGGSAGRTEPCGK